MEYELTHHGIKGMKWGVRRYQNKDGTLTPAGKKRRSDVENMSTEELRKKVNRMNMERRYVELTGNMSRTSRIAGGVEKATKPAADINKVYKSAVGKNNPNAKVTGASIDTVARTARLTQKVSNSAHVKEARMKLDKMTDAELAKHIERLDLERQYSRLERSSINRGKVRVSEILDVAGDVVGLGASAVVMAVGIKKLMK